MRDTILLKRLQREFYNYGIVNNAEIFGNSVVTFCTRLSIIKAFSIKIKTMFFISDDQKVE